METIFLELARLAYVHPHTAEHLSDRIVEGLLVIAIIKGLDLLRDGQGEGVKA